MNQSEAMHKSERWMQTWPQTMAKGPVRFVAWHVVGFVFFMALGRLVFGLFRSGPLWDDSTYRLSEVVFHVPIGIAIGLSQWVRANRLYAGRTGDQRARYWAERHYELPTAAWMSVVAALAVIMTVVTGVMAWTSGAPAWWAVTLLCAGICTLLAVTIPTVRKSTTGL